MAVVLGAGGSARAVMAALIELRVPEIRLVNRTIERAAALACALGGLGTRISVHNWETRRQSRQWRPSDIGDFVQIMD